MDRFLNIMKAQSAALDQGQGQPRFGVVTSVDPNSYTARVTLQPEGVLTGWLPILSPWIGAGWGMACPPTPGDQVMLLSQEGDAEHGVIIGRTFSDVQRPPSDATGPAPAGELWLTHASGSFLKLRNDGSIEISGSGCTVTGDLHVAGDVYDQHGSMAMLRGHYNEHVHPDPHGGNTAGPNPTD